MLKWHLIGNQGNRGENYRGFVNAGVKYRSFANAYGHCEKMQHYVLCLRHICEQNPPVAGVYEKANAGSEATAWCETALSSSEVLQKERPEGGNHIPFHCRRVENTQVSTARLNGGALSKLL